MACCPEINRGQIDILDRSFREQGASKSGSAQRAAVHANRREVRSVQICSRKIGMIKKGTVQLGAAQIGATKACARETRRPAVAEFYAVKMSVTEVDPLKHRAAEIRSRKTRTDKLGIAQIAMTELRM
jgi:hypothetical protein